MGGPQLGEFEAGLAAAAFGAPIAVAAGGVGVLLTAALVGWKVPGLAAFRFDPGDPPDPPGPTSSPPARTQTVALAPPTVVRRA